MKNIFIIFGLLIAGCATSELNEIPIFYNTQTNSIIEEMESVELQVEPELNLTNVTSTVDIIDPLIHNVTWKITYRLGNGYGRVWRVANINFTDMGGIWFWSNDGSVIMLRENYEIILIKLNDWTHEDLIPSIQIVPPLPLEEIAPTPERKLL
tara:strand:+ start:6722 stop:7180 length:459 start_codon:yes stop_codon:yes gene_type:complete